MDFSRFLEAIRQGCVDPDHARRYHGKGSAPSPDYRGAAVAQGAANKEAALQTAAISNPEISNPFGSQSVGYSFRPDIQAFVPSITQSLTPVGQQRFDQEQRINTGLGDLAETGLGFVENTLGTPFDQSQLPERTVNAGQTGQDAILSRLEPQIKSDREALRTQLLNQGLQQGHEAYDSAFSELGERENDLRIQAGLHGIGLGDQARSKAIQEEEFFRTEPLNILNAVRSASPVQVPQFQNYSGANVGASPLFGAAQSQGQFDLGNFGIQTGARNNLLGGLFGLGAGYMLGGPWGAAAGAAAGSRM